MAKIIKIHAMKQPRRPHFIPQWAAKRGLSQADLARELGADKSVVSRWYAGASPGIDWQKRLAALFHIDEEALFRAPEDDWLKHLFAKRKLLKEILASRSDPELDRIERMLQAAFPPKDGTNY